MDRPLLRDGGISGNPIGRCRVISTRKEQGLILQGIGAAGQSSEVGRRSVVSPASTGSVTPLLMPIPAGLPVGDGFGGMAESLNLNSSFKRNTLHYRAEVKHDY